jgi:hypothetical protein
MDQIKATKQRWDHPQRLMELCRLGDPQGTIEMFRRAYRLKDHRLFEIGLAGGFLCEDPESDAKKFSYLLLAASRRSGEPFSDKWDK